MFTIFITQPVQENDMPFLRRKRKDEKAPKAQRLTALQKDSSRVEKTRPLVVQHSTSSQKAPPKVTPAPALVPPTPISKPAPASKTQLEVSPPDELKTKPSTDSSKSVPVNMSQLVSQMEADEGSFYSDPCLIKHHDLIKRLETVLNMSQREDLRLAEKRFFEAKQKGICFTNATGTGKTFLGMGIAVSFLARDLKKVLVVTPSVTKCQDWGKVAKEYFGLNLEILPTIVDEGKTNFVTCTYANLRENDRLQRRHFDLVIYDESHRISAGQKEANGMPTATEIAHENLVKYPRKEKSRPDYTMGDEQAKIYKLLDLPENSGKAKQDELYKQLHLAELKSDYEERLQFLSCRVVFLSATPFAYPENLGYANGILFNLTNMREFLLKELGYQQKGNRRSAVEPDSVELARRTQQFHELLVDDGALSTRTADFDGDFKRYFVKTETSLIVSKLFDELFSLAKGNKNLSSYLTRSWSEQSQMMEAIKAKEACERARKHIQEGRKVVIFHSYKNIKSDWKSLGKPSELGLEPDVLKKMQRFLREVSSLKNVIETFKAEFDNTVAFLNGDISQKNRNKAISDFNSGDKSIIVVQMEAGKEGIDLHDKIGNKPRAMICLGLPIRPTDVIQMEGRVNRYGMKSNSIVEYLVLHTTFEMHYFGSKVHKRLAFVESMAMGTASRNLTLLFAKGYLDAELIQPKNQINYGAKSAVSELPKIASLESEMVRICGILKGQKCLEPFAGSGLIAEHFPSHSKNTFLEPNQETAAKLLVQVGHIGDVKDIELGQLYAGSHYDSIVTNAVEKNRKDLVRLLAHLRPGGRAVLLIKPSSKLANKRLQIIAKISLPTTLYNEPVDLVVIDNKGEKAKLLECKHYDFSQCSQEELLNELKSVQVKRNVDKATPLFVVSEQIEVE